MKPWILFDYIYYRIAWFFDVRFNYSHSKKEAGVGILSLIQFFNILALFDLIGIKDILVKNLNIFLFIGALVLLFILNYIRYIRLVKFNKLEEMWGEEKPKVKHIRSVLIIIYFLLSFYLLAP